MSERDPKAIIDEVGQGLEEGFRIMDASFDPRISKIALELASGIMRPGKVIHSHMWEAVEVAIDHGISVERIDEACLISLIRHREANDAHEA